MKYTSFFSPRTEKSALRMNIRECSLFMGRGGWQMGGGGGKQSLLPYLGGGGVRKVLLWIWERGGGGQKSLKVDIISFGFFLFKFFQNRMTFNVLIPQ